MKAVTRKICYLGLVMLFIIGVTANEVFSDGTESLGPPLDITIESGSGIVIGGVGLGSGLPGTIDVNVPAGTTVKQTLLYWSGFFLNDPNPAPETMAITVDGNDVIGKLIGGPTRFFTNAFAATYRADITDLGVVDAGLNMFEVGDTSFDRKAHGAGVLVIFDNGIDKSDIQIRDGTDTAHIRFDGLRKNTVPQTFMFEKSDEMRTADLAIITGDVAGSNRPNVVKVTVGDSPPMNFVNMLFASDGGQWDSLLLPIDIPAGAESLTVEIISVNFDNPESLDPIPTSVIWNAAGLSILPKEEEEPECEPCEGGVSELTLKYLGETEVEVKVTPRRKKKDPDVILFEDVVSADDPIFTVVGMGKNGKIGSEMSIFVDGELNTKIHTSCSQPIGPGLISGDFEVIEGFSVKGGRICETNGDGEVSECTKGAELQMIVMKYTGKDCGASEHSQQAKKFSCEGDPEFASEVSILASDKSDPDSNKAKLWFNGLVGLDGTFTIDAANASQNKLKADTFVHIFDNDSGELLQSVKFHTSCSQPLNVGDQFGSLQLMELVVK